MSSYVERPPLTVRQLIAALQALPESDQDKPVFSTAEAGYVGIVIVGVGPVKADSVYLESD